MEQGDIINDAPRGDKRINRFANSDALGAKSSVISRSLPRDMHTRNNQRFEQ